MASKVEENALNLVKERNPNGENFNVHHVFENFFNGNLVTVGFTVTPPNGSPVALENYIYFDGKNSHHYRFQHEFLHDISKREKKPSVLNHTIEVFGVSGSIALLLTLAIVFLAVTQRPIPDILANGLTVIIGFYFGAQVLKK